MEILTEALGLLFDPASWSPEVGLKSSGAISTRLLEHLVLCVSSLLAASVPALGLGIYIGHKRRFEFITVTVANLGRAVPSFAILALAFTAALRLRISFEFWPAFVALFFLAIPPLLTNAYVGVREVDRDTVEAARGMGMNGRQILVRLELPLALPLIVAGLRTSTVQVIATATLAAITAGGGLGRFIVDGFARNDRPLILAGAILVAALAVGAELALGFCEKAVRPRTRSERRTTARPIEPVQPARPA
ncbi:MAG: ABC transporter permease [Actinomycetota bacterium]